MSTTKSFSLHARPRFVVALAVAIVALGTTAYAFPGESSVATVSAPQVAKPAVAAHSATPKAAPVAPAAPRIKTIRISAAVPIAQAQQANNRCAGPITYQWGPTPPIVTQHNYCGGTALVAVEPGETVRIIGGGLDGLYRVTANRHYIDGYGPVTQIKRSWGDVVLATCVSSTHEVAVGLDRVGA